MPGKSILLVIIWIFNLKVTDSFAQLSQAAADFSELALCTLIARKAWTTRKLPAALAYLQGHMALEARKSTAAVRGSVAFI